MSIPLESHCAIERHQVAVVRRSMLTNICRAGVHFVLHGKNAGNFEQV